MNPFSPALGPPGASFQILTTPSSGQYRNQCQGAGGIYSEHCQQPGQMMPGMYGTGNYYGLGIAMGPAPGLPGLPAGLPGPAPIIPLGPVIPPAAPAAPAAPAPPTIPSPAESMFPITPDRLNRPPCTTYCTFPDGRHAIRMPGGQWQPPLTSLMGMGFGAWDTVPTSVKQDILLWSGILGVVCFVGAKYAIKTSTKKAAALGVGVAAGHYLLQRSQA